MISWRGPGASPIPTDKCATSRHWPRDCGLGSMICTKRGRRKQRRLILENISNKGRQTSTYNPHPSLDIVYLRLYQTPFWMFGLPSWTSPLSHLYHWFPGFVLYRRVKANCTRESERYKNWTILWVPYESYIGIWILWPNRVIFN